VSNSRSGAIALTIAIAGAVWSLILLATGGFDVTLIGVTVTAHDVTRPAAAAAIAFGAYLWARGPRAIAAALARRARVVDGWLARLTIPDRAAIAAAWMMAAAVATAGVVWSSGVAGGADSYGYVSQAELWRRGGLPIVAQPFAAQAPWPDAEWTFTPLGYSVAAGGGSIVPTYSPGLPLVMAAVKTLLGHAAIFWIAPLAGAVLVIVACEAGRRLSSARAGLAAAWLVATSQTLLGDLMVPTSDLLAAAGSSLACVLLLRDSRAAVAAAGLAVAIALPVRPNLVLTAAVLPAWLLLATRPGRSPRRQRLVDVAIFAAAAAPGVLIPAWANWRLHGSPLLSGYGALPDIYRASYLVANLQQYTTRLVEAAAWLAPLGLAAVLIPVRRLWPTVRDRSLVALVAAWVGSLIAQYLFYDPVHADLRFLLPGWIFVMLGLAQIGLVLARPGWRASLVALGIVAYGASAVYRTSERGGLDVRSERKYSAAAAAARARTERGSVLFASQHSGSGRYYAGRMTLRYDLLDPQWLDRAIDWLAGRGVRSYALLDDWEVKEFRQRFAGQARVSQLDVPVFIYTGAVSTHFYDLTRPASERRAPETIVDRFDGPRFPLPAPAPVFDLGR
jgi:hypothetical protein